MSDTLTQATGETSELACFVTRNYQRHAIVYRFSCPVAVPPALSLRFAGQNHISPGQSAIAILDERLRDGLNILNCVRRAKLTEVCPRFSTDDHGNCSVTDIRLVFRHMPDPAADNTSGADATWQGFHHGVLSIVATWEGSLISWLIRLHERVLNEQGIEVAEPTPAQ